MTRDEWELTLGYLERAVRSTKQALADLTAKPTPREQIPAAFGGTLRPVTLTHQRSGIDCTGRPDCEQCVLDWALHGGGLWVVHRHDDQQEQATAPAT